MKKLFFNSIAFMIVIFMFLSVLSCAETHDDVGKVSNSINSTSNVTLRDLIIAEEFDEENNGNLFIAQKRSIYGSVEQDIFYNDSIVYGQNIYMMGTQYKKIQAFTMKKSLIQKVTNNPNEVSLFSQSSLPLWLLPNMDYENKSMTQNYLGIAYLLRNTTKNMSQTINSNHLCKQEIVQISLAKNIILNTYSVESCCTLETFRCGLVKNNNLLIASNLLKNPKTLLISPFENSGSLSFDILVAFDKDILSWDCVLDSLIVVLEDQTVQKYQLVFNEGQLALSEPLLLTSVPSKESNVCIKYNPIKRCIFFWEVMHDRKSWFYSESSTVKNWIYVGTNSFCVLSMFAPDVPEEDNFEVFPYFSLMKKDTVLLEGPKAWIQSPCFLYLTNTDNNLSLQWVKIDYQHYFEGA